MVLIILLPHRPMQMREILLWFESMTVLAVLLLAVHCHLTRGAGKTWRLFGTGVLYGLVLESSGVAIGFFAE